MVGWVQSQPRTSEGQIKAVPRHNTWKEMYRPHERSCFAVLHETSSPQLIVDTCGEVFIRGMCEHE